MLLPPRRRARSAQESPHARKMHRVSLSLLLQQRLALADIDRNAPQYSLEAVKRFADGEAAAIDAKLANRRFMHAGAFLDDRHRAPDVAERLEIAQQNHRVGEICYIHRRFHIAD